MSADELDQFIERMMAALDMVATNGPAPGRRRYLFTTIRFPLDGDQADAGTARSDTEQHVEVDDAGKSN